MLKKTLYLKAMGISVWHLRANLLPAELMAYCVLLSHNSRDVALLVADAVRQDAEEIALLNAMMVAMKVQGEVEQKVLDFTLAQCQPHTTLIIMGERCCQSWLQDSVENLRGSARKQDALNIIATYSPAVLLENPHLKRFAWQDLQRAMQLW